MFIVILFQDFSYFIGCKEYVNIHAYYTKSLWILSIYDILHKIEHGQVMDASVIC